MTQSDFDIFLSYKREQRHLVEQLYRRLISEGYRVVYDNSMGTRDIVGDAISKWIDSAKLVIVLWTDDSVASEWVRTEARAAVKEKNYLGIVVDDINPKDLPIETRDLNSLNISDGTFENGLSRIVKEVAKRISPDDDAGTTADAASGEMVRQNALYMFADRVGSPEAFKQFAAEFDSGVLTQLALQRLENLPPDPNLEKIQKLEKNLADYEARLTQEKKRLSERSSEINALETRNAKLYHETEALREKSTKAVRAFFSRNKLLLIITPALVFLAMAVTILIQSITVSDLRWRAVSYDENWDFVRDEVKDFTLSEWVVLSVDAFKNGEFDLPVDGCATRDKKPGIMVGARCYTRDASDFSYFFSLNEGIPLDLGNLKYMANLESISLSDKGRLSGLEVFPELNELETFTAFDMEVDVCAVARAPNIQLIATVTESVGDWDNSQNGRREIEAFLQACN